MKKTSTCIVGIEDNKGVYIGGDSAGISGDEISTRSDKKIFRNGHFIMGFTSSFRMGQLLQYKLDPPIQDPEIDDYEFLVTYFIDSVRQCFIDNGYGNVSSNEFGQFMFGYNGKLYYVDEDLQLGTDANNYMSLGCGSPYALGSLFSTKGKSTKTRIKTALEAAAEFSTGVCPPFYIVEQLKPKE